MWRLLKQVNATLLTLIPKVRSPNLVADFRPISCCNVLYKIITKILGQHIPSQNAFLPGRLIGDNILLAQELFSGYKQARLPPRYALKVDLRTTYDTVEWDFMLATLRLFGFPEVFVYWIEECVSTAHFSICLNGTSYDFFVGARGLRQGDPMSPYLFVLIMEADEPSVRLFRRELHLFASLSGLHANPQKSQLILSKAAQPSREVLLASLGFQEGHLPVRFASRLQKGGQGLKDILALNRALMSQHLWAIIARDRNSIWVNWMFRHAFKTSPYGRSRRGRAHGEEKLLKLRPILQTNIQFCVGDGMRFSLWHDPWHTLGPLILRYPRGPQLTGTCSSATLSLVLDNGQWRWPLFTDIACSDNVHLLPPIHPGTDRVTWRPNGGAFSTRHMICSDLWVPSYSRHCLAHIREHVRFPWPHIAWEHGIEWASARWRGKHIVNAAYRALLASLVYHIWQERNRRRFQSTSRPPVIVGSLIVDEIK
ncbi:UNVERIFIED_CONTAM: LINE-1 reverse transcriptase [Sesamum latifolium]|uniref:LINE-1 reverse transcriptase n=1 Tax=Sesamum latifolium TaxID=2727402 RepID=A0AAW2WWE2_9LAMI